MKITEIETIPVRSEVRNVVIAYSRTTYETYQKTGRLPEPTGPVYGGALVVKVHTDEGIVGLGETGGGIRTAEELQKRIAPRVIGEDPFDVERIHERIDPTPYSDPYLRVPIDCALYDIMGKALGVPAYKLLGGCYRRNIPVAWVIGYKPLEQTAQDALKYVREGFKTIKLKEGLDPEVDVERVRAVREAVGKDANIRVDFNCAYSAADAIKVIQKMEPYGLEFAEQPVAREDLEGMAKVADAVETPISADDSIYTPDDALRVIERKAADVINVYVLEAGGLTNCKKIAAIAESADIPCFVGAAPALSLEDVFGAHFAASTRNINYACEFVGRLWYERSELKTPVEVKDGVAVAPEGPGLGVELDEEGIEAMRAPT